MKLTVKTKFSGGADIPMFSDEEGLNKLIKGCWDNYVIYSKTCNMYSGYDNIKPKVVYNDFDSFVNDVKGSGTIPLFPRIKNHLPLPIDVESFEDLNFEDYDIIIRSGAAIKGLTCVKNSLSVNTDLKLCGDVVNSTDDVIWHPINKALVQLVYVGNEQYAAEISTNSLYYVEKEHFVDFYNTVFNANLNAEDYDNVYDVINEYNKINVKFDNKKGICIPAHTTSVFPIFLQFVTDNKKTPDYVETLDIEESKGAVVTYSGLGSDFIETRTLIDADYPRPISAVLHNHGEYDIWLSFNDMAFNITYIDSIAESNYGKSGEIIVLDAERTGGFGHTN